MSFAGHFDKFMFGRRGIPRPDRKAPPNPELTLTLATGTITLMGAPQFLTRGRLQVAIFDSAVALAEAVSEAFAQAVASEVRRRGEAAVVLATGNSQLAFLQALRARDDVPWDRVEVFHLDEYLGLPADHPASFRRYLHEQLVDHVRPRAFHEIRGDAPDAAAEAARYSDLVRRHPVCVCVCGIGENGHLAFNDPPADFATEEVMQVVRLDERSRAQQVGEGHFPSLGDAPERAITMTVPAMLRATEVLVVCPEARKADAVAAALDGPVTPDCPASILQAAAARLYLDRASSSLLAGVG